MGSIWKMEENGIDSFRRGAVTFPKDIKIKPETKIKTTHNKGFQGKMYLYRISL